MGRTGICKYCRHYKTKTLEGMVVSERCAVFQMQDFSLIGNVIGLARS